MTTPAPIIDVDTHFEQLDEINDDLHRIKDNIARKFNPLGDAHIVDEAYVTSDNFHELEKLLNSYLDIVSQRIDAVEDVAERS